MTTNNDAAHRAPADATQAGELPEWFKQADKLAADVVEIVLQTPGNRLSDHDRKRIRALCEFYAVPDATPPNDAGGAGLREAATRLIAGGLTYTDDLGRWCIGCGEADEWAGDHFEINHKPDCAVVALTTALAAQPSASAEVVRAVDLSITEQLYDWMTESVNYIPKQDRPAIIKRLLEIKEILRAAQAQEGEK